MSADIMLCFARVLVSSVFLLSAYDKFRLVPEEVAAMTAMGLPNPPVWMRLTGICEIIGSVMLIVGIAPRLAAILFAVFTLFVSALFLRFWKTPKDEPAYMLQRNTLFSNFAMIGALIYIAVEGPGAIALTQSY